MNEKEVMNLLNSIDDDLVDKKIDELMSKKGEVINMGRIKSRAVDKLNEQGSRKRKIGKKPVIAAAVAATLLISAVAVNAAEISKAIKSFFNKSAVYSTVVDGDAFYLPEEVKLNDDLTLVNFSVSKDRAMMMVRSSEQLDDKGFEGLNIAVVPKNDAKTTYAVSGYMPVDNGECHFLLMNDTKNDMSVTPFKDFTLTIAGGSYDISLAKAESVNVDDLVVGKSGAEADDSDTQNTELIANVAGKAEAKDGKTNIQLVAGFDDPDLKLRALGKSVLTEFKHGFENRENDSIGYSSSSAVNPILAYDADNNPYTLEIPEDSVGNPATLFETDAAHGTGLTVKLPSISVGYNRIIENLTLEIPREGEIAVNKELDFIIQKAKVTSVKRISENTAVVEFELNTGNDKTVSIIDMGTYSSNVKQGDTVINGNKATMTITFDKDIEEARFSFSWPTYSIQGNWAIELDGAK